MSNENVVVYGSPNDIVKMTTLKIEPSPNESLKIFANGQHECKVDISLQATDVNGHVVNLSDHDWVNITSLRFYDSADKLNWKGHGWGYTDNKGQYYHPYPQSSVAESAQAPVEVADGVHILSYYVYTDVFEDQAIAVSVDLDNGTSFMTTKSPKGAQPSSVTVNTMKPLQYAANKGATDAETVTLEADYKLAKDKGYLDYSTGTGLYRNKKFDKWYDNYYLTVPYGIADYSFGYTPDDGLMGYTSESDNQHAFIVHPKGRKDTQGYDFTVKVPDSESISLVYTLTYYLNMTVQLNPRDNTPCLSHLDFETSQEWYLHDGDGLRTPWAYDGGWYIEFHDIYGNYGTVNYAVNPDKRGLHITSRSA